MKILFIALGVVSAIWIGLEFHSSQSPDRLDTVLLTEIGLTFGAVAAVMVSGTRHWSARAVGTLLGVIGVSVRFLALAWAWQFGPFVMVVRSDGASYRLGLPNEGVIDAARALLFVSGPMLLWGVGRWWRQRWTYRDPTQLDIAIDNAGGAPTLVTETARVADETARLADATEEANQQRQ